MDFQSAKKKIASEWVDNEYYDLAEKSDWLDGFWADGGVFFSKFKTMDLTHVVELACGHGRHVNKYIDKCETLTLVDMLQENIDFCKERFQGLQNIDYVVTPGNSFYSIADNSKTAIFSYDAMVHFEVLDVAAYLIDAFRILAPGGRLLLHHSNYTANPGGSLADNPGGKKFYGC